MKMKMKMKMMAGMDGMGRACDIILILELERSQIIRRFADSQSVPALSFSPLMDGWMWWP